MWLPHKIQLATTGSFKLLLPVQPANHERSPTTKEMQTRCDEKQNSSFVCVVFVSDEWRSSHEFSRMAQRAVLPASPARPWPPRQSRRSPARLETKTAWFALSRQAQPPKRPFVLEDLQLKFSWAFVCSEVSSGTASIIIGLLTETNRSNLSRNIWQVVEFQGSFFMQAEQEPTKFSTYIHPFSSIMHWEVVRCNF